ncbi:hypothetical protein Maeo_1241 [Methanococcus aeolicus Nankai-3]|uniref:Uncharacterized protein n=1 Tax=Methanococcus aeolicus (strain ATCC BAA-1280 / DSM 17508 / OCM 812 / Nankai-3) TaxID=419665 RepID=A6UWE5_META3|nr:hypothetical protein [Methanococcus aeolicus]ABR56817.1 hypothetical protein Maeo_1241 [Methanococcus aeolicus Nankai-3]
MKYNFYIYPGGNAKKIILNPILKDASIYEINPNGAGGEYLIKPNIVSEYLINPILKNAVNYAINPTGEVKGYLIKPNIVSDYLINPILKNAVNYIINPSNEVRENLVIPDNNVLEVELSGSGNPITQLFTSASHQYNITPSSVVSEYLIKPSVVSEYLINPILKDASIYEINPNGAGSEYLIKPNIVSEYLINPILKNAVNYAINPTGEVKGYLINPTLKDALIYGINPSNKVRENLVIPDDNNILEYIIKPTASFYIYPNGNVDDFKIIPYYKLFGGGAHEYNTANTYTTTFVGNEIFSSSTENFEVPNLLDIIDYPFNIPNFNISDIKIYTGYLYFNLTIETFGYGLWRGSNLCSAPSSIMVFPSAYKLNNGNTYWGTDIQPNMGSIKNSHIGFFGSKRRDLLAEWGIDDAQYIQFIKNMALEWMKLMSDYGTEWNNHLLDTPKTVNIARGMEYASNVMDAVSSYGVEGLMQLGKEKIGNTYEEIKDNPETLLYIGLSYAVEEVAGAVLAGVGLSAGLAFAGALLVGVTFPIDQLMDDWKEWKKTHGTGWQSYAGFACNYIDPTNPDGLWHDWAENCLDLAGSIADWLGLNPSEKSWDDWYNELSEYSYNSIIGEELEEISFMVRDCGYSTASYDGWLMKKYHLVNANSFQTPQYELKQMISLPNGDIFLKPLDFNADKLFNRPFTSLIILKNWEKDYPLLSQVIENNDISTFYICSSYPSYIQMQLFNIPKIKLG